jgi:hypothetical protein
MEKTTMLNSREALKSFMKPEANAKEATGKAKRLLDDEDAPGLTLHVPTVGTPKQLASQAATMLFGTTGSPQLDYKAGNSQLLMDYRAALIKAFELGNDIKELYGIIPPKIIFWDRKEAHMQLVPTTLVLSVG